MSAQLVSPHQSHAWSEIYRDLWAADRECPLAAEDLERLATAAYLIGKDTESDEIWARAQREFTARNEPERAARCAFWLAFGLLERGESAGASGWLARARRLLDECGRDCVESGYLLLPEAIRHISEGDIAAAHAGFGEAAAIGKRFREPDLIALARHGEGRALIRLGRLAEGVALLDEAMVAVTAGEVSAIAAGDVYCGVISGCQEIFDWRRAQEWTIALTRWCAGQPDMVHYRGQCLLRRAEVMQLRGACLEAMEEARRARERLVEPPGQPGLGAAYYQLGELHRLRGELDEAETEYKEANRHGRMPEPGLALLRLAQGEVEAAVASIRRVVQESQAPRTRPRVLAAAAHILLAAGDVAAARAAADELAALAVAIGAPYLIALSAQITGAVRLAEGDGRQALRSLREAARVWQELKAPYEVACVRALLGLACRELGDVSGCEVELDAACAAFRQLGAALDLERVEQRRRAHAVAEPTGLTPRELQVLRLVAAGASNRAIAGQLRISERTVARHVSNIFVKLGLSSRAAAAAYAYRHSLVQSGPPT
ncbi:MAG: LuxR C-terminal-related transcriptional regulator [Gemmatimonadales bacterium]